MSIARVKRAEKALGADKGTRDLLTLSDGTRYRVYPLPDPDPDEHRRWLRDAVIQPLLEKVRAGGYDLIALEASDWHGLAQLPLGQACWDAGWQALDDLLALSAEMACVGLVFVRSGWSSQTCSLCGYVHIERAAPYRGQRSRRFECDGCDAVGDHDQNAANVLADRALVDWNAPSDKPHKWVIPRGYEVGTVIEQLRRGNPFWPRVGPYGAGEAASADVP